MIHPRDYDALRKALDAEEVVFTIEAGGQCVRFKESDCTKIVSGSSRAVERAYLLEKRYLELARTVLHARGELDV